MSDTPKPRFWGGFFDGLCIGILLGAAGGFYGAWAILGGAWTP